MRLLRADVFGAKGNWRTIRDPGGAVIAIQTVSMINAADPYFHPLSDLYSTLAFPETNLPDDGYGFNEYNVHFLSLCMKVRPLPTFRVLGVLGLRVLGWGLTVSASYCESCFHCCKHPWYPNGSEVISLVYLPARADCGSLFIMPDEPC